MKEITFTIERCEESDAFVASWDDPSGHGGITTQGHSLQEIEAGIRAAVRCHFDAGEMPGLEFCHQQTRSFFKRSAQNLQPLMPSRL